MCRKVKHIGTGLNCIQYVCLITNNNSSAIGKLAVYIRGCIEKIVQSKKTVSWLYHIRSKKKMLANSCRTQEPYLESWIQILSENRFACIGYLNIDGE